MGRRSSPRTAAKPHAQPVRCNPIVPTRAAWGSCGRTNDAHGAPPFVLHRVTLRQAPENLPPGKPPAQVDAPAPAPAPTAVATPDKVPVPTAVDGEGVSPTALLEEFFAVAAAPDAAITVAGVIIFMRQLDVLRATMPPTAPAGGPLRIPRVRYRHAAPGSSHETQSTNGAACNACLRLVQGRAVAKVLCAPADRRTQRAP